MSVSDSSGENPLNVVNQKRNAGGQFQTGFDVDALVDSDDDNFQMIKKSTMSGSHNKYN